MSFTRLADRILDKVVGKSSAKAATCEWRNCSIPGCQKYCCLQSGRWVCGACACP